MLDHSTCLSSVFVNAYSLHLVTTVCVVSYVGVLTFYICAVEKNGGQVGGGCSNQSSWGKYQQQPLQSFSLVTDIPCNFHMKIINLLYLCHLQTQVAFQN
jgi:hypothetical protein